MESSGEKEEGEEGGGGGRLINKATSCQNVGEQLVESSREKGEGEGGWEATQ